MNTHYPSTAGLLLIVTAAVGLYVMNLNPARFGAYHDDGIYAVTAKALATGQGYRIISLPDQPAQTKYPPLYPSLLSLIWRLRPNFPENLPALMRLSVALTALFLALSYGYLVRRNYAGRWTALFIVALIAFNWRIIFFATNLFSDTLYMILSLAALWLAEEYSARGRIGLGGAAGLFLGLASLTRTIGVVLLAAVAVYFLIQRQYKRLAVIFLVSALFIVPWLLWQRVHRMATQDPVAIYYTDYLADFHTQMTDPRLALRIFAKNLFYLTLVFLPSVSLSYDFRDPRFVNSFLAPPIFVSALISLGLIVLGLMVRWRADTRLPHIYVAFYLGMLVIWPYASQDRFLIPLLPFLWLYMITAVGWLLWPGLEARVRRAWRKTTAGFAITLVILGSSVLCAYAASVSGLLRGARDSTRYAQQERLMLAWIDRNTQPTDMLLAYHDPVVYLYSGRRTARTILLPIRGFYSDAFALDPSDTRIFLDRVRSSHAQYLILTVQDFHLEYQSDRVRKVVERAIAESPSVFTLVYATPEPFAKVYRIRPIP